VGSRMSCPRKRPLHDLRSFYNYHFVMRGLIMSASTRVRLLRWSGVLLILLGIVHLVATPHIATLIQHSASRASADRLTPPMLLNHVLVGLLLFPLGYLTVYAAPYSAAGLA